MPKADWRSWHLLVLFAFGCVIEWVGESLKKWSGNRLKKRWFPGDGDDDS